jgi:hypothetical protein
MCEGEDEAFHLPLGALQAADVLQGHIRNPLERDLPGERAETLRYTPEEILPPTESDLFGALRGPFHMPPPAHPIS